VARLVVPPLRERPEDVTALIRHFVMELTGSQELPFHPTQLEAFERHHWAGNVRELRNVVESTLAMGGAEPALGPPSQAPSAPLRPYKEARAQVVDAFERSYLPQLIAACDGNASEAARRAQMDRAYLLSLLKRHGLR
jgi:DNA-binding NtrC family response regulator